MSKDDYRSFFANVKAFLKMSYFLKRNGLAPSTFTLFMKGSDFDYMISLERLNAIYSDICKTLDKIA